MTSTPSATPSADSTAGEVLGPALLELAHKVHKTAHRVVTSALMPQPRPNADTEAVHDFRVALRRLRSLLKPGKGVFGKKHLQAIDKKLAAVAKATNPLREEEVLRETLGSLALDPSTRDQVDQWLKLRVRGQRAWHLRVVRLLAPALATPSKRLQVITVDGDGKSFSHIPLQIDGCLKQLEHRVSDAEHKSRFAVKLAQKHLQKAVDRIQKFAHRDPSDSGAMHRLRIGFKQLRYLAEGFSPILGTTGESLIAWATRMQRCLGDLHDVDEAIERIQRAKALAPVARTAVLEALRIKRIEYMEKVAIRLTETAILQQDPA